MRKLPVFPLGNFKFGDLRLRLGMPEAEVTDQVLTVTVAGRFRPAEIASPGGADGLAVVDVGRPVRPWLRPQDHEQNIGGRKEVMAAGERGTGTQSIERAVRLLREVAAHANRGARLTDLVATTGLPRGTARRLLAAMIREGLMEQDEQTRRYFLGPETFKRPSEKSTLHGLFQIDNPTVARDTNQNYTIDG